METKRKPYPSDASDEEWAFVAPYLTLLPLDANQRQHSLREVFNALRYLVRSGIPWVYATALLWTLRRYRDNMGRVYALVCRWQG